MNNLQRGFKLQLLCTFAKLRCLKKYIKELQSLRNLPYLERLRALNSSSLEERREREDLIETYKILTGKKNVPGINQNITKGNSMKLYKPRLNKSVLQRVFFFSVFLL